MNWKRLARAVVCALLLVAGGSGPLAADWPTDQQNHMLPLFYALWSKYSDDLEGGDARKLASWFTEEAVLMEPGRDDVVGRAGIQKYVEDIFSRGRITDAEVRPGQTEVCGDRVYQFGTYSRSFQVGSSPSASSNGRYFSIWDRQQDGSWKISRLMFSETNPVTARR